MQTASQPRDCFATASILCALPDATISSLLREALAPVKPAFSPNGYEALKSINQAAYDAYVLDYWLPDWSGVSLCREIRKTDPNVPICIYSRTRSRDAQKRAYRAGADLFLNMPHDALLFRERLESLLRSRARSMHHAPVESAFAIRAELDRQAALLREIDAGRKAGASALMERQVRAIALKAFLGVGGTLAAFERTWKNVYAQMQSPDTEAQAA